MAQRSPVAVEEKDNVSDSNEDPQPEFGGVAIVEKAQKHLSPRTINSHPRLAGMKRHDLDRIEKVKESEASVGSRESLDNSKHILQPKEFAPMIYLAAPRSNSLVNPEMQRIHKAMHSKPVLQRTSTRTQSQRLVYLTRMAASALHLNQMKRLWTRHSLRVR